MNKIKSEKIKTKVTKGNKQKVKFKKEIICQFAATVEVGIIRACKELHLQKIIKFRLSI